MAPHTATKASGHGLPATRRRRGPRDDRDPTVANDTFVVVAKNSAGKHLRAWEDDCNRYEGRDAPRAFAPAMTTTHIGAGTRTTAIAAAANIGGMLARPITDGFGVHGHVERVPDIVVVAPFVTLDVLGSPSSMRRSRRPTARRRACDCES